VTVARWILDLRRSSCASIPPVSACCKSGPSQTLRSLNDALPLSQLAGLRAATEAPDAKQTEQRAEAPDEDSAPPCSSGHDRSGHRAVGRVVENADGLASPERGRIRADRVLEVYFLPWCSILHHRCIKWSAPSARVFVAVSTTTPGARTAFARTLRFSCGGALPGREARRLARKRMGRTIPVHLCCLAIAVRTASGSAHWISALVASVKTFGRKASSLYFRQVSRSSALRRSSGELVCGPGHQACRAPRLKRESLERPRKTRCTRRAPSARARLRPHTSAKT